MNEELCKKAYEWALTYDFSETEIDYSSRLTLKMLDDSCNMSHDERKVFFYVYDAITDREDITLDDEVNQLLKLARNRQTIFSKPQFAPIVRACKAEIMQTTEKKFMKRFKKLVRNQFNMTASDGEE
jgi:hypothetical protein